MAAYDVVVVGAGSAGCAVVNRLCRSSELAVCLVEAGPDYGPPSSGQWPPELLNCHRMPSTHDWGYSAQGADGSTFPEPRSPPEVHERLALDLDTDRRSSLAPLLEISHKFLGYSFKLWMVKPLDLTRVDTLLNRGKTRHDLIPLDWLLLHWS